MKYLITILFFTTLTNSTKAQFCDYYFSFDANDSIYHDHIFIDTSDQGNIWQIGSTNKSVFDSAYSLPNAIMTDTLLPYATNDSSAFVIILPKWFDQDSNIVAFPYEIQFRYKMSIDSFDYGIIETSDDGGTNWIPPDHFTQTVTSWQNYTAQLYGTGVDPSDFYIRFIFVSDSIPSLKSGWIIDNICIKYWYADYVRQVEDLEFSLFPNPSTGHIKLTSQTGTLKGSIQVTNLSGQTVYQTNHIPATGDLHLLLPDGL